MKKKGGRKNRHENASKTRDRFVYLNRRTAQGKSSGIRQKRYHIAEKRQKGTEPSGIVMPVVLSVFVQKCKKINRNLVGTGKM